MKQFLITIKLFCKTLSIIIPYVLLLLCINIGLYQIAKAFADAASDPEQLSDAMYFFGDINIVCFVLYLFFLFIGYEYMRKARESQMEEIFSSYGIAGQGIYIRQFFVLLLSVVIVSVNISMYFMWGWKNLSCADELLGEVVRLLFVNVFLLSLGSVSMGTVLSGVKNRFTGYVIIVCLLFFILPNTVTFYESLQREYHVPVFFIRDLIYLIPPDLTASPDPLYAFPLENYRIAAMALWIVCAVLFLTWKLWKNKKRMRNVIAVCLCLLLGVLVYQTESKGSILLMKDHPESALELQFVSSDHEEKEEAPDFFVLKYELDVTIDKELEVEARMTLEQDQDLTEYHFTLDHGYRVEKVVDPNGVPLAYSRDWDYLCVEAGKEKISELCISYKGHNPVFYANQKACFLPGFFAYYPKAGYQKGYEHETGHGYAWHKEPETMFEVKIDRGSMISNLPKTDTGFQGVSETVSLIDGYYSVSEEDGHQILSYPLMESEDEGNRMRLREIPEEWERLKEYLGISGEAGRFELPQTVFMVPGSLAFNSMLRELYPYEDHVILSHNVTAYDVLESKIGEVSPEKKLLCETFFSWRPDEDFIPGVMYCYKEEDGFAGYEDEREEVNDVFAEKIEELGVRDFSRQVVQYLLDENDDTDSLTFLKSMRKRV